MSSFSLIPALSGYECDMTEKTMSFKPVINKNHFKSFWINGKAWGTYEQSIGEDGVVKSGIQVLYGSLDGVRILER